MEELFRRYAFILHLLIDGRRIKTTSEHPFYVLNRGWVPAGELRRGDRLCSHDGQWIAIEEVLNAGDFQLVFNVRVADYHTYFVGGEDWGFSVWAHNAYKPDIKQIDAIQKKTGMSDTLREIFHEELHQAIRATDGGKLSFKEMLELAKELMKQFPNK